MKADQQQRGIPVRMDGCKRKKIFVKDFCCVTKVQNGPPKRERERERAASLFEKEKSTNPQGKGRRNTKRGRMSKVESKVKTTPQKREGGKGTKSMDR
jgi:hypothetical protein